MKTSQWRRAVESKCVFSARLKALSDRSSANELERPWVTYRNTLWHEASHGLFATAELVFIDNRKGDEITSNILQCAERIAEVKRL